MELEMIKKILIGIIISALSIGGLYAAWRISSKASAPQKFNIKIKKDDNKKGDNKAKVVLVEYSDFQCPACRNMSGPLGDIVEKNKKDILFVYRHFPLPLHNNAKLAARAAEAAGISGKFWEMHDVLFENQNEWGESSRPEEIFLKYAKSLKIDGAQFKKDINSQEIINKIDLQTKSANAFGVRATPTFFLNGEKVSGYRTLSDFENIINKAIEKSKAKN